MSKSPAFQFYPDDFMGGKPGMMTPEQTHVLIWLMCLDWNQNGFPFDAFTLARWCRVTPAVLRRAWVVVQECFSSKDGRWFNERLEKERVKQADWREKSAKGGSTKRQPPFQPIGNDPSKKTRTKREPKGNTPVSVSVSVSSLQTPVIPTGGVADATESETVEITPPEQPAVLNNGQEGEEVLPKTSTTWVAILGDDWKLITGGLPNYAKLGKHLKPAVDAYGMDRVREAWKRFCASPEHKYGPANFVEHLGDFETRIIGVNGEYTLDELREIGVVQ